MFHKVDTIHHSSKNIPSDLRIDGKYYGKDFYTRLKICWLDFYSKLITVQKFNPG